MFHNYKMVDNRLVDKILQQGQKLRTSMIESILKNDPFNTDIIYNQHFNTPQTTRTSLLKKKDIEEQSLSSVEQKRLDAFIRGECMSKEEEQLALDTLRSLSAPELCRTTARSLQSDTQNICQCSTCKLYNSYLRSNYKQRHKISTSIEPVNEITKDIQENYHYENELFLKHIDSLKVSVHSLKLSERGMQKVLTDCKDRVPFLSMNFFLEYRLPDQLITNKSTMNSFSENYVRLCSKMCNDSVSFKHVSVHDVKYVDIVDLNKLDVEFKISYRCPKQKSLNKLGFATFNFGMFLTSRNLTCSRSLSVFLSSEAPILVGTLKLSLQFGCGRLYFGQEFVDAINSSQTKDCVISENGTSSSSLTTNAPPSSKLKFREVEIQTEQKGVTHAAVTTKHVTDVKHDKVKAQDKFCVSKVTQTDNPVYNTNKEVNRDFDVHGSIPLTAEIEDIESTVLLGFIYISEAQYLTEPTNSYLVCQLFNESESFSDSKVILHSSRPLFNYSQLIPLLLNSKLLYSFRENYMVIEFWKLEESRRSLIGFAKVPLHQFYLAYRNSFITKHLLRRELPVIGVDDWEQIYSPNVEEIVGQVEVLVALGSEEQIDKLKSRRGFTTVKPKLRTLSNQEHQRQTLLTDSDPDDSKNHNQVASLKKHLKGDDKGLMQDIKEKNNVVDKIEVAVQSNMDTGNKMDNQNQLTTQDMLSSFVNQLMQQRQKNVCVENSTNTEPIQASNSNVTVQDAQNRTNFELRKTSDLLDNLQKALSADDKPKTRETCCEEVTFKSTITIVSANHLPARKKCKPKKSKNRSFKNEDILPSCYVTFETLADVEVYTTPVILKSTSPVWNYKRDVYLPVDLLKNGQKRLIFKVWRKPTNAVTCPNMQTDVVLGFAALDLTILLAGFPNIQGWFNIVDFSGKCNGQLNVHITPLEDLSKYQRKHVQQADMHTTGDKATIPEEQNNVAEPSELLSRALKRKFSELDEITQRLRLRLSKVTNEESDSSSDGMAEEFERDINTLSIEDDFDTINFDEEARKLQLEKHYSNSEKNAGVPLLMKDKEGKAATSSCNLMSYSDVSVSKNSRVSTTVMSKESDVDMSKGSEVSLDKVDGPAGGHLKLSLDQQLQEGKQHINSLLEKLTLLSSAASGSNTSRYVSGCSTSGVNVDTEAILQELDYSSRPNIQSSLGFDPLKFQQLYGDTAFAREVQSGSSSSLVTQLSSSRAAPEGQGNNSDSTVVSTD